MLGEIERDKCYTLKRFMEITGMGRWAMRQARKDGLRVLRQGNRGFVNGSDFHDHLARMNASTKNSEQLA